MFMNVSVLQEAVSTGDPELVQLVLQYRDFKRATERLAGIPELLSKLRQVPIFLLHSKYAAELTKRQVFYKVHKILALLFLSGTRLLCRNEVGVHQLGYVSHRDQFQHYSSWLAPHVETFKKRYNFK